MAAPANEPVAFAELIRAVLVVLIALGWVTIDSDTVNVIVSMAGVVLSWILTGLARNRVRPMPPPGSQL